jgi:hypothetical protein
MMDLKTAAQEAITAFETFECSDANERTECRRIADLLKAAIASSAASQGEPVAWQERQATRGGWSAWYHCNRVPSQVVRNASAAYQWRPLYAATSASERQPCNADLMTVVEHIIDEGRLSTEGLGRLRNAWENALSAPERQQGVDAKWCAQCGEGTVPGLCRSKVEAPGCQFAPAPAATRAGEAITILRDVELTMRHMGMTTHYTYGQVAAFLHRAALTAQPTQAPPVAREAKKIGDPYAAFDYIQAKVRKDMQPMYDAFAAKPAAPSAEQGTWPTEAQVDEYIDDYVLEGVENESGAEGYYTPNERERFLIKDAILGLIATQPAAPVVPNKP